MKRTFTADEFDDVVTALNDMSNAHAVRIDGSDMFLTYEGVRTPFAVVLDDEGNYCLTVLP